MLNRIRNIFKRYSIFMILYLIVYLTVINITHFYVLYIILSGLFVFFIGFFLIFLYRREKELSEYSYDIAILILMLFLFVFLIKTSEEKFQLIFMIGFLSLSIIGFALSKLLKSLSEHAQILVDTIWISLLTLFVFESVQLITGRDHSAYLYVTMAIATTFAITSFLIINFFKGYYQNHYKICPIINRDLNARLIIKNKNEV